MTFLNWKITGNRGDRLLIKTDTFANVRLLDPMNFEHYRRGSPYKGEGGWSDKLSVEFLLPYKGTFYAVVDLGGTAGTVKATCDLRRM
jgi:Domain of unknown function (DUF1883)